VIPLVSFALSVLADLVAVIALVVIWRRKETVTTPA
jgi:hypothetical protein